MSESGRKGGRRVDRREGSRIRGEEALSVLSILLKFHFELKYF